MSLVLSGSVRVNAILPTVLMIQNVLVDGLQDLLHGKDSW